MPELFRMFGMKLYFYMNKHLPIHIHVRNEDTETRFEVEIVKLIESKGIKPKDLVLAEALIKERKVEIIKKWNEVFGKS